MELKVIQHLLTNFPVKTPKRLQQIVEVGTCIMSSTTELDVLSTVTLNIESDIDKFSFSEHCISVMILKEKFIQTRSYTEYDIPTIALPSTLFCCNKSIKIDNRYCKALMYDICKVSNLKNYHGRCRDCKTSYYYNYQENNDGSRTYNDNDSFLMLTSQLAFSSDLLKYIDGMVAIGAMSFERTTKVYSHVIGSQSVNKNNIENIWFLYRILQYRKHFQIWPRKNHGETDTEQLCKFVYSDIKEFIDNKWIKHICEDPGCRTRALIVDGNEKIYRLICGAPKERIVGITGRPNIYKGCINFPVVGNKYAPPSKFCESHTAEMSGPTEEQMDIRPATRSYFQTLDRTVEINEGCKKSECINRYYERSAGMFYYFRSCGVRVSHHEMYSAEAYSDLFVNLVDLFGNNPDPADVSAIVYDRACGFKPFLDRLAKEGNNDARNYAKLDFIVDRFHIAKHTEKKCDITSELCAYHPDLPQFVTYRCLNTEIAEQSFGPINWFKCSTRKMSLCRRLLFFKLIDDSANTSIISTKQGSSKS